MMPQFLLSWELSVMLAVMAATLLVSSELLMRYYGRVDVRLSRKRLSQASLVVTVLFVATIALKVVSLLITH